MFSNFFMFTIINFIFRSHRNDAVSIVLTTTVMPTKQTGDDLLSINRGQAIILAINRFCLTFFASAGIGVIFALMSALLLKYVGKFLKKIDMIENVINFIYQCNV